MLLKIKSKSAKQITLESTDGKVVVVGYQKNAILLYKLSNLEVGAEVDLDVKASDVSLGYSGNLYVDLGDKFMQKQQVAKAYLIEERRMAKMLAELDA